MRYLRCSASLVILILFFFSSNAQSKKTRAYTDTPNYVSAHQLDSTIIICTNLLNTKKLDQITDEQHKTIIRCANTIFMHGGINPDGYNYQSGICVTFKTAFHNKNYDREIIKVYPDWYPNRGMGYYFRKLDIELGGTAHIWSRFTLL